MHSLTIASLILCAILGLRGAIRAIIRANRVIDNPAPHPFRPCECRGPWGADGGCPACKGDGWRP